MRGTDGVPTNPLLTNDARIPATAPPTNTQFEARTKLAAEYADKTTLDTVAADVAGLDGAAMPASQVGPGGVDTEITCQVGGVPIEGVECWITSVDDGTNVIAGPLVSDALGKVTFMLEDDSGPWYVWRQKSGVTFENPQTIVWNEDDEQYELES
jgi:hypothetical protein